MVCAGSILGIRRLLGAGLALAGAATAAMVDIGTCGRSCPAPTTT